MIFPKAAFFVLDVNYGTAFRRQQIEHKHSATSVCCVRSVKSGAVFGKLSVTT